MRRIRFRRSTAKAMDVMRRLGFMLAEGPEIETPYYNFDALNIPPNHPPATCRTRSGCPETWSSARTPARFRHARSRQRPPLPIKIACAGRVYRNEAVDTTHLAMFHQFEGLWVDKGLTFGHLKGLLIAIARSIYGEQHEFRFKPKYYPYTEPSLGMDLRCAACAGAGCHACHGGGWVTLLGAGMVHPKVFLGFGYDPREIGGLAFGLGISRIAAQAFGVVDMKSLYDQDLRIHAAIHRGGL